MRQFGLRHLLYGTLCVSVLAASTKSGSAIETTSTCPYRTVNYITHTLPQQCLPSSRRIVSSTTSEGAKNITDKNESYGAVNATSTRNADSITSTDIQAQNDVVSASIITTNTPNVSAALSDTSNLTSSSATTANLRVASVEEEESPLEEGKFLSFEDWKKQNLQNAGQSEHVGKAARNEAREVRKRPSNLHGSLDSIGDDAEIELDFSGLIPEKPQILSSSETLSRINPDSPKQNDQDGSIPKARSRSNDAGTTSKERFNYASFDCAANILKTNPEAKSALSVLIENKDSYMLNDCSANNKFIIFELCNDISIDTIVLANFEFFSSIFRTFQVSVSDKYPVKVDKWKSLGIFEARNSREIQAFLVENPVIWARYLRIEFLTHYGHEFYCPVSLIRVHGTTMLEEYKHDLESLQPEDDDNVEEGESIIQIEEARSELKEELETPPISIKVPAQNESQIVSQPEIKSRTTNQYGNNQTELTDLLEDPASHTISVSSQTDQLEHTPTKVPPPATCAAEPYQLRWADSSSTLKVTNLSRASHNPAPSSSIAGEAKIGNDTMARKNHEDHETLYSSSSLPSNSKESQPSEFKPSELNSSSPRSTTNSTALDRTKASPTSTQIQSPIPTMQESFFKSVQKRLQMLESNSSLSLQYIEDQSRALRDAFNKMEHRQSSKMVGFLEYLNTTVLSELRDFRQQYDQLWQSTVIELEIQREQYKKETVAFDTRLAVLTEELIFQKRISILQMLLICVCLSLVIFSKGSLNNYLEMPIVQSVLSRSPSSRWLNSSYTGTPSTSPAVARTSSDSHMTKRHSILKGHRRTPSEESTDSMFNPTDLYSPPTPASYRDASDAEHSKGEESLDEPDFDPESIERPSTSPPMLPSTGTPSIPDFSNQVAHGTIESRLKDYDTPVQNSRMLVEEANPRSKHLTWHLPDH